MDDGLPSRLTRLTRRLLDPGGGPARAVEHVLRDLSGLWSPAPPVLRAGTPAPGSVAEVTDFGANPGRLRMLRYTPAVPPRAGAPVLVLLHGCGQDAGSFARASGFTALADRLGALLLLPDQRVENNPGRCFNWFEPAKIRRDAGEAASISAMVAATLGTFRGDPGRVFVAGLSAGAAMAAAMLVAYPDVFAGGAVVAGLPVGVATDVRSALARMRGAGAESRADLVARAAPARDGAAAWPRMPRLSIWHGGADGTVDPANADALVAQWTGLLGLPEAPDREEVVAPGVLRRAWGGGVEQWRLAGFGHAFPAAVPGTDPFVLPAPVGATEAIARFWGLLPA